MTEKKLGAPVNDELVTVCLFKDSEKNSQPLTVTINGKSTVIPRGVPFQVSRDVKDVLDNKGVLDNKTIDMMVGLQNEFEAATNAQNGK